MNVVHPDFGTRLDPRFKRIAELQKRAEQLFPQWDDNQRAEWIAARVLADKIGLKAEVSKVYPRVAPRFVRDSGIPYGVEFGVSQRVLEWRNAA